MLSESPHPDLRAAHSFDSSRPASAHNVSSPVSKWPDLRPHNFLAVPNTRSRGNSVDSEEPGQSSSTYSGQTSVSSLALTTDDRSGTGFSNDNIINDQNALKPDNEAAEADFDVQDNKFAFSPGQLGKMLNPKSLAAFYAMGGLRGLEKGLRTDCISGLSLDESYLDGIVPFDQAVGCDKSKALTQPGDRLLRRSTTTGTRRIIENSFTDRKRVFEDNRLPEKKPKSFLQLAWMAYKDKVLLLLSVAAAVSLAVGIYQALTVKGEAPVQWVEGVAIITAIFIVVLVGTANDYQKELQFVKLNKKKDERKVRIIRSGRSREISVHDVLVGDVMHLEPGDMVPVDGIFISGHNLRCDESTATGESDLIRKYAGDEVYAAIDAHRNVSKMDPFIISGAKVAEGIGTFLVTAVGINSSHGKIIMSFQDETQSTPLQTKLDSLAEWISKLALAAGLLLFVVTFIKWTTRLKHMTGGASAKGQSFLQVFIVAVTIVVVAVPEGLPLAVTLALAFATTQMLKENNLVRLLRACETMGNATTICSDKTGTLTQNKMSTVAGTLGTTARFGGKKSPNASAATSPDTPTTGKTSDLQDYPIADFLSSLAVDVKALVKQSIAVNSTAFEGEDDEGRPAFIGSKTETALLDFARVYLAMDSVSEERENANVVQFVPFDSSRKCMAVIVKLKDKQYRMLVKGASEILVAKCSQIIDDPIIKVSETKLMDETLKALEDTIDSYASRSLRTIGLVYKDFAQWPPRGTPTQKDDPKLADFDHVFKDMTFLGVIGIQDPLRPGVAQAVSECQKAGILVRMVTGDNLMTAKAIAEECGIYTEGGVVMEGPIFRDLSPEDKDGIIPKLQVLARSSPGDKRILVERLKGLGETVAVTGDGTNDAPALKKADVGFSMGISGTEVAKEASDIVLMDDNFASIVKAIMWGRAVNDSVKKFLQVCSSLSILITIC